MHRPLCASDLFPNGALLRLGRQVFCLADVESTNAYLLSRCSEFPDGTVITAEFQQSGRGRLGRSWSAPRGSSILMSVLLHEPAGSALLVGAAGRSAGAAPRASLLAALAACEAIEDQTDCRPVLRWPNDLYLANRKVGGVLVEATPMPASPCGEQRRGVVIGIGINCLQHRGHFEGPLAARATSLEIESALPIDRSSLARALVLRLDAHLNSISRGADADALLRGEWLRRCQELGAHLSLQNDGQTYRGTILDITEEGDLLVQLEQGGRRCFGAATTTRIP